MLCVYNTPNEANPGSHVPFVFNELFTCHHNMHDCPELFTVQILILVSRSGHAYLLLKISLALDSGRVMHMFIRKAYARCGVAARKYERDALLIDLSQTFPLQVF